MHQPAAAEQTLRIATFAAPLSREGPGLLLRDIHSAEDPQIAATARIIDAVGPDVLLLTDFDYDHELIALQAFNETLDRPYEHLFAGPPNAGLATSLDLDGNGRTGEPRDAQGYGRFFGDGGMALLSRLPVDEARVIDHSPMLWRDLPGAQLPKLEDAPFPSEQAQAVQHLSSTGHWEVPLLMAEGPALWLWAFDATPPVFDGPEDRNGLRNRDELRLWETRLGEVGHTRVVILGNFNLDPWDGQGDREAMRAFLSRSDVQDPRPRSAGAAEAANAEHAGPAELDTADWADEGPGNLRVSYVVPHADLAVRDAGVFWPAEGAPDRSLIGADGLVAGPHRLVWVDLQLP